MFLNAKKDLPSNLNASNELLSLDKTFLQISIVSWYFFFENNNFAKSMLTSNSRILLRLRIYYSKYKKRIEWSQYSDYKKSRGNIVIGDKHEVHYKKLV